MAMREKRPSRIIAVSMGDPAGIGPEVVLKALLDVAIRRIAHFIVIGNQKILERTAGMLGVRFSYRMVSSPEELLESGRRVGLIHFKEAEVDSIKLGSVSALAGRASVEYVEKGIELCRKGEVDALVTGPINKEAIYKAGYDWAGHTELLASATGTSDVVMMMVGGKLRVSLVTTHIPLRRVFRNLSIERILKVIQITDDSLRRYFGFRRPRIGVSGFNPHASDGGRFGDEEALYIKPAIKKAAISGIRTEGPISPDVLFMKALEGAYDAEVVMYHDQGLIPIKMHAFGSAVNVTLGLPIIRTSVDHGTGFDIAGKGVASASSMKAAIRLAIHMAGLRSSSRGRKA